MIDVSKCLLDITLSACTEDDFAIRQKNARKERVDGLSMIEFVTLHEDERAFVQRSHFELWC